MPAARAAFAGLIDYAGLFPPASLPLDDVVRNYGEYRNGTHAWILGRLIVPCEKLPDLESLAKSAGATPEARWPVSVLIGTAAASDAAAVTIREVTSPNSVLNIESVEGSAAAAADIAKLAAAFPTSLDRFVEIPPEPDPDLIAEIGKHGCAAKVRAGGVIAEAFPSPARLARLLTRASAARVPLKATAGLHHAVRGDRRLTYAEDSASATMHGFVNLVLASTLLTAGRIDEDLAEALLEDDRPEAFKFGGRAGSWLNAVVTYSEIAHARRTLLRSVGSCSFDEPVTELVSLGFVE